MPDVLLKLYGFFVLGWWRHPCFHIETDVPAPFAWLGYWLVTWEYGRNDWPRNFSVSFMPD